jgi:death-on-curing protein
MSEPVWVQAAVVLAIHRRQLAEHGGPEGVRDEGLLASALAKPKNLLAYEGEAPDLATLAAAYADGIVRNQPFVDGNKRTALVVCRAFLQRNGQDIAASSEEKYLTFLGLAEGTVSLEQLASWLRSRMGPLPE